MYKHGPLCTERERERERERDTHTHTHTHTHTDAHYTDMNNNILKLNPNEDGVLNVRLVLN